MAWVIDEPGLYHPGSDECSLAAPNGSVVLFFRAPDRTVVKNRAHMDLRARDSTRDAVENGQECLLMSARNEKGRVGLGGTVWRGGVARRRGEEALRVTRKAGAGGAPGARGPRVEGDESLGGVLVTLQPQPEV